MQRHWKWVLALALALLLPAGSWGQGIDGTLRGEVKDPQGLLVAGAKVTVKNDETGLERSQETTSAGTFNFPNLLVGSYTITIEYKGFKKAVVKATVKGNQVTDLPLSLEIGSEATTVTVEGGTELVQTTTSQVGTTWERRQLTELPLPALSGDPQNLAILQTGTTTQSGGVVGVGGSIGGNRPRNNNFVLDGVDNNDVTVTGPIQRVIPDAVADFTLLTNQFSAEYGHSTAGQFIQTTKSGTNELHGNVFYFVNNRKFNSVDNLNQGVERPRFDRNRLGATGGGPILKDKLFFFGAYQFTNLRVASVASSVFDVPTAAGFATLSSLAGNPATGVRTVSVNALNSVLTPASTASGTVSVRNDATGALVPVEVGPASPAAPSFTESHDYQINVDWNPGTAHRVSGRFASNRDRSPNTSAFPIPVFTGSIAVDNRSVTLSHVWTMTPTVVNELRAGYRRNIFQLTVPGLTPPGTLDVYPNFIIEELAGLELGPDGNAPQSGAINSYQWVDTLSISRGKHNVKLGADARLWIAPSVFLPRERAEYRYSDLNTFVHDLVPDNLALRGVGDGSFAGNQKAIFFFVQDDWKIHPRVTLNLGVRYEFITNARDSAKQAINSTADLVNPTRAGFPELLFRVPKQDINNWGARVGLAWDVFGDSKTSLRAGFAQAYDVIFQNLPLLQLPPQLQQELDPGQACTLTPAPSWCATGTNFIAGGGLPGTFIPQTLDPASARAFTQGLIVDTVAPESYTWMLSIQREFLRDYTVEVRYLGNRGLKLPVQVRRNARLVPPANLFLPTFFSNSEVPATVPLTAPSLANFSAAAVRPYAVDGFFANITAFDPIGNSFYHGGSVELTRRFSGVSRWGNGLFVRTGYTWSRAIDDSTNELFTSQVNPRRPQDHRNVPNEKSLSAIHHEHKYTLAVIYELPKFTGDSGFLKRLLNQWQVSASFIAETGQPVTALSFIDANGNGDAAGDRAILNPNFTAGSTATDVNAVCRSATGTTSIVAPSACSAGSTVGYVAINSGAQFVRARPGARATVGRNTLTSAGINNWNLSFSKKTAISERYNVEFRVDMLNTFNHGQPILGSGNINAFTDAAINGTDLAFVGANSSFQRPGLVFSNGIQPPFRRLIQFGLKVNF